MIGPGRTILFRKEIVGEVLSRGGFGFLLLRRSKRGSMIRLRRLDYPGYGDGLRDLASPFLQIFDFRLEAT